MRTALFLVAILPGAPTQDPWPVLDRASAAYARITTLSADFVQIVDNPMIGGPDTTRGRLFLERPVPRLRSLRWSVAAVHEQGGIAIPAHPLVPYPLCAQGFVLRRLLDDADPAARPDAIETFNPTAFGRYWHERVVRFAAEHDLAQVGNSDAHAAESIGTGWTTFPGTTEADVRAAILARTTRHHGSFHGAVGQLGTFGRQLRKYGRDARAEVGGRLRRDGTGRDHGYPGGHLRPPRFEHADGEAGR